MQLNLSTLNWRCLSCNTYLDSNYLNGWNDGFKAAQPNRLVGVTRCADCGAPIGHDSGPNDGWQLEDGRTVCHACCVRDTRKLIAKIINSTNEKGQR